MPGQQAPIHELSFQHNIYMLDDNSSARNDIDDRYTIFTSNLITNIAYENKIDDRKFKIEWKTDWNNIVYLYGILPEKLMPAAYVPVHREDMKITFDILTMKDRLSDEYYRNVYKESDVPADINVLKKTLHDKLQDIFNKLDSPSNYYNSFDLKTMIILCMLFWMFIIIFLLKALYCYYHYIYKYILLTITILVLFFAIIFKIFYTLQ